jgi:hypothetical protein
MAATVTTLADARVEFVAAYARNPGKPDHFVVPAAANRTGTVTWRWVIPAVPNGPGLVAALATSGPRSGVYSIPIEIASTCR